MIHSKSSVTGKLFELEFISLSSCSQVIVEIWKVDNVYWSEISIESLGLNKVGGSFCPHPGGIWLQLVYYNAFKDENNLR